jgi:hypothetical protein
VIWIGDRSAIESIQPVMISSKICMDWSYLREPFRRECFQLIASST